LIINNTHNVSDFWVELCPKFEDENVSEEFSAETEIYEIGAWTQRRAADHVGPVPAAAASAGRVALEVAVAFADGSGESNVCDGLILKVSLQRQAF
jgi:hypothetical protein